MPSCTHFPFTNCPITHWSSPSLCFETRRGSRTRLVCPALRGAAPGAVPGRVECGDADHVPRVAGQVFESDCCLREEKDLHLLRVILGVALPVINLLRQWDVLVYPTPRKYLGIAGIKDQQDGAVLLWTLTSNGILMLFTTCPIFYLPLANSLESRDCGVEYITQNQTEEYGLMTADKSCQSSPMRGQLLNSPWNVSCLSAPASWYDAP